MNSKAILLTSMVMTLSTLLLLAEVRGTLNGSKEYQQLAEFWKSKVAREQLKKQLVIGRFNDFKQGVAVLLPAQIKNLQSDEEQQALRNLASVIPQERSLNIQLSLSADKLLKEGKESIKKREFDSGIRTLSTLIDKFPDSHHVIEAHYLIVLALSKQQKHPEVIERVDKMVELFPENRLTGYALLKAGGLYELDGRQEDAIRIYRTIVAVYSDQNLVAQAKVAVRELEL